MAAERTITFKTNQEEFKIPLRFFLYQSSAAQPSKTPTLSGGIINLTEYDVKVVKVFIARILEPLKSYKYDYSIIRELYELAQIFQLQRLAQEIESQILSSIENPSIDEFGQYITLLNDKEIYSTKFGGDLLKNVLSKFDALSSTDFLLNLDGTILTTILDSCELLVDSEVKVFEVGLKFLKKSNDRLLYAFSILGCIRMARISDSQREEMLKELGELPQAPQILAICGFVFNEENFYRCCVLKSHEKFPRCGNIPKDLHGTVNTIYSNKIKLYNDLNRPEHQRDSYLTATGSQVTTVRKPMARSSRVERRLLREIKAKAAWEKSYLRYFPNSNFDQE
uniref:BACK domain-containing protein n=1 Tax=Panagrolaimus davidi TaxID=227884 RepID=A0A914QCA3_9BILA